MEGSVIFGNDGVARFKSSSEEKIAVPLVLIQEYLGLGDYPFFVQKMRHAAILEEGSTVGTFLLCLAPWADVCSDLTDRDVESYIAELRKPSSDAPAFDRCEIRTTFAIGRDMVHEPIPEDVNLMEWLNRPREVQWADSYNIDKHFSICGYKDGDPSNYSMSTSIHKLKNVLLVVNPQSILYAGGTKVDNAPLLTECPGVFQHGDGEDRGDRYIKGTTNDIMVDSTLSVETLVRTVIEDGLWFQTPSGAINERMLLEAIVENLDAAKENEAATTADEETDSAKKISIAEGAFDGIVSHCEREDIEWKQLLSAVQPTSQYPFRIGTIKEGSPKDDRAFGLIFSEDNDD